MMFGYLRFVSIFCTINIAVFIVSTSVFTFRSIASDSVGQNTSATNNPLQTQQYRTLPNTSQSTFFVTPQTNQNVTPLQQPQPELQLQPRLKRLQLQPQPQSQPQSQPLQPQQQFRYIVPVALQNQPANQVENQPANPHVNSPIEPPVDSLVNPLVDPPSNQTPDSPLNPSQLNIVTQNQPTSDPALLPAPLPPALPDVGTTNPFQYREPDGGVGLVPRNISSLPAGIQVIGIMILNEQKSIAAIRIPKTNTTQRGSSSAQNSDVFYVREGDIIEVSAGILTTNRTNRGTTTPSAEVLFLVVEKITSQHVEVRSRSNIADKHILR
jgi:hypothetical protein